MSGWVKIINEKKLNKIYKNNESWLNIQNDIIQSIEHL